VQSAEENIPFSGFLRGLPKISGPQFHSGTVIFGDFWNNKGRCIEIQEAARMRDSFKKEKKKEAARFLQTE